MSDYSTIMTMYDQPWRHYHNRQHVYDVHNALTTITRNMHCLSGIDMLDLYRAIDLHDVVYTVMGTQNEEACAIIAESYGFPEAARLIRLTQNHKPESDDILGQLLVDSDLYGLAFDYKINGLKIRTEVMAWCKLQRIPWDDTLWVDGRAKWLRSFLDRPQIYFTNPMQQYEATARANMQEELDSL